MRGCARPKAWQGLVPGLIWRRCEAWLRRWQRLCMPPGIVRLLCKAQAAALPLWPLYQGRVCSAWPAIVLRLVLWGVSLRIVLLRSLCSGSGAATQRLAAC